MRKCQRCGAKNVAFEQVEDVVFVEDHTRFLPVHIARALLGKDSYVETVVCKSCAREARRQAEQADRDARKLKKEEMRRLFHL